MQKAKQKRKTINSETGREKTKAVRLREVLREIKKRSKSEKGLREDANADMETKP